MQAWRRFIAKHCFCRFSWKLKSVASCENSLHEDLRESSSDEKKREANKDLLNRRIDEGESLKLMFEKCGSRSFVFTIIGCTAAHRLRFQLDKRAMIMECLCLIIS